MSEAEDRAFLAVEEALLSDPDDDVRSDERALTVRGALFAFRSEDGALVVDLPAGRARDLLDRGIAAPARVDAAPRGAWVAVADTEDWVEMATEAHQFVGEPGVGRDS